MRRLRAALLILAVAVAGASCKRGVSGASASDAGEDVSGVVVKADSEGLLLTWIDDKGDFHVETRVADVPLMGRDSVRVVDPNKEDGTHADRIFVVDLRQANADGRFPVRSMTRADFEALAVARREKTGPTLADTTPSSAPSATAPQQAPGAAGTQAPSAAPAVIIYGAEWCGACHDAARYLRKKGVAFIEKDVEKDANAAREMQQKLAKNGLRGGSIPVIDVRGKVMVGFSAPEIENALGQAL